MLAEIQKRGLWASKGATPEATLYAAIIREIAAKGELRRVLGFRDTRPRHSFGGVRCGLLRMPRRTCCRSLHVGQQGMRNLCLALGGSSRGSLSLAHT